MAELAENESRFTSAGCRLVVIGTGDPVHFEAFREVTGYGGRLLTDPSRKVFDALGFVDGVSGLMSVRSVFKGMSALSRGHRQGSIQGSALQLGGALVVDSSPAVRYYFASAKMGDHPPVAALLNAV